MFANKFSDQIKILRPLFVIGGCTGTGKSDLGIELAKHFNGEIINADSMQIYKGLDIVTNKVTTEEMQGIPHHLMSFCDPCESNYNVHQYRDAVLPLIESLWANGKLPIIVGGTGYYMEAAIYYDNLVQTNAEKSDALRQQLLQKFPSCDLLHEELKRIDPISAAEIHKNAKIKVLRALEIFHSTGVKKSEHHKNQREGQSKCHLAGRLRSKNTMLFILDAEKNVLNQRLGSRVDSMINRGLINELDAFYNEHQEQLISFGILQCIGLKEFLPYLKLSETKRYSKAGQRLLKESVELIKLHTRQYAKTQRNWFYNRIHLRGKYREVPHSVALNTSVNFREVVVPFAIDVAERFLSDQNICDSLPTTPVLMSLPMTMTNKLFELPDYEQSKGMKYCGICDIKAEITEWGNHLKGKRHRNTTSNLISDLSRHLSGEECNQ